MASDLKLQQFPSNRAVYNTVYPTNEARKRASMAALGSINEEKEPQEVTNGIQKIKMSKVFEPNNLHKRISFGPMKVRKFGGKRLSRKKNVNRKNTTKRKTK
jgi:hypothetical protein